LFNATFIGASLDLEETLVSPVFIPAVGNKPVISTIFSSPSKNFDGMTSKGRATGVMIDT